MSVAYSNQFDFLTRGPHAQFVRETRSAGTQPIHIVHSAQPEGDFSDPAHSEMVLIQVLGSKAPTTRDFGAGRVRHPFRYGDFELQPPNVATSIVAEGDHEVRGFILPFGRLRDVLGDKRHGSNGDFGYLHATPFRDFFLERLCERLWEECEGGNPNGDLFADTALAMIAATLSGLAGESDRLSRGRLGEVGDRIVEYIDVHLDQSIALDDLATLSNMPEMQFLAVFKATFGTTPHQYVLSRRIARAQELLAAGEMPLAEIAYACGFASQSHMTDVFREKLGVTPGRYRKEVRS